ncbi:ABC transporter permease [Candidatus Protofrankia californiensis]|uniref:ABC transporter permease n=1 Tax=Candidatus Protofrankia californiensis TaxID=1839754 RepID=A0A1C3P273_9ACTN|nr:ABC transporter permease [Candidatus Protofrankia californiensis]
MTSTTHEVPKTVTIDAAAVVTTVTEVGRSVRPARGRRRLGLGKPIPFGRLLGVLLLIGIWSLVSATGLVDPRKLSEPWTVLQTGIDLIANGQLQDNIAASLHRAVLGFAFGVAVGTGLALISGLSRIGEALVDGPVQVKRAIPSLALIPLMILWLGIGETFKVAVIAIVVAIAMYIQTHAALTAIDSRYVELAEVLGLSRWNFIRKVVIPGAQPGFFLGLRLAVTASWLTLVVVESVNAVNGLGKMMFKAQDYGQSDVIMVGLVVYGLFGFVSDAAIRIIERRVLSWRRTLAG